MLLVTCVKQGQKPADKQEGSMFCSVLWRPSFCPKGCRSVAETNYGGQGADLHQHSVGPVRKVRGSSCVLCSGDLQVVVVRRRGDFSWGNQVRYSRVEGRTVLRPSQLICRPNSVHQHIFSQACYWKVVSAGPLQGCVGVNRSSFAQLLLDSVSFPCPQPCTRHRLSHTTLHSLHLMTVAFPCPKYGRRPSIRFDWVERKWTSLRQPRKPRVRRAPHWSSKHPLESRFAGCSVSMRRW